MRFWEMIGLNSSLGREINGYYDPVLVALSVAIAALAAYSALGVVERMSAAGRARSRVLWHAIGAAAMGCGIWAMHFTAMLALSLPMAISYDLALTALSVFPALVGSACALHFMAQGSMNVWRLQTGALLMAVGIGLMHYTGMDAMRMQAAMRYDATLFAFSILVAHLLATVALYIRFKIAGSVGKRAWVPLLGAGAMGCAVAGMHYTAMAAAHYYDTGSGQILTTAGISATALATIITALTTLFLGLTIIGVLIDRRMEQMNRSLADSESRRRIVLETMVDGLFTVDTAGAIESANPAAERILGYDAGQLIGLPLHATVQHTTANGQPYPQEESGIYGTLRSDTVHETDSGVFWRRDGSSFPVEYTATPMHEDGRIVGAVVTFRDISKRRNNEREKRKLHQQLVDISRQAGQAEIATGVLHNVGNVLNSINVSAGVLAEKIRNSKSAKLVKVSELLQDHGKDLSAFLTKDKKGVQLPSYVRTLAEHLLAERDNVLAEFQSITDNITHINEIVSGQQSFASNGGLNQPIAVGELLDDAMAMNVGERHDIRVSREYEDIPEVIADKHKMLQIVVNLMRNAKQSVNVFRNEDRRIKLSLSQADNRVRIAVTDNGGGIAAENLDRVFEYGYTTKEDGHGFGLHASANAAAEMGGRLTGHSDGLGKGATFVLEIPAAADEIAA